MKMWTRISVLVVVALGVVIGDAAAQYDPCNIPPGIYRTQTQGGWSAVCHGDNPGCIRDDNFDGAFPAGLTVGETFTIHLTTSAAVPDFLPEGGTPSVLTANHTDPVSTEAGVFGGQVVALAISLGFSDYGVPTFGDLGSLVVPVGVHTPWGPFAGYTVREIFDLANVVLGGDSTVLPDGISISDLNDVVDAINNDFIDGEQSNGYLVEADCDSTLPVELTSFEAIPGDHKVTLTWTTASETDNAYFSILRNGTEIGQVEGSGNSATANDYQYVDRAVVNGATYSYQIVSYDINGARHDYGMTAEATPQAIMATAYMLDQNYPNPFNPLTSISYGLKEPGFVSLKVYNLLGREVATLVAKDLPAGRYTVNFTAKDLPSGIYVYRLEVNDFSAQKKLILLK
jgi:hypothetical protein